MSGQQPSGQRVRPLADAEAAAFRLGRLAASQTVPYLMHGIFAARPLAAPGLGTFAVDRWWRLYLDPALLVGPGAWAPATVGAVLTHEVGHLLRDHAGRGDALPPPYVHRAWNLASDAELNDDLLAAGLPLPDGVVTPARLGCPDGGLAEDYYAALRRPPAADVGSGDAPGCGSGAGCPPVPGELPEDDAAGEPLSAAEGDLVRRRVATEVTSHVGGAGRGTVPAGLARWAGDVLAAPTVPWERVLRAAVRRAVADRAGRSDYSYARPSRRTVPGLVRPSMRGPSVGVSVVVDTSGSMSEADLTAALGEVQGVLRSSGVARDRLRLLSCDATAGTATRVRTVQSVRLTGGGGTDMRVGIRAAERHRPAPDVVVVLTDGDTPWPQRPGRARLVCAVISGSPPQGTPPWATTVHIPPAG